MEKFNRLQTHYYYKVELTDKSFNKNIMLYDFNFEGRRISIPNRTFEFSSGHSPITYREFTDKVKGTEFLTVEGIFKK